MYIFVSRFAQIVGIAGAVLTLLIISAAEAREGFYLGAGLAIQDAGEDLDGTNAFLDDAVTVLILAGELDSGSGLALKIGYGFNDNVAIEYLFARTTHTANHGLVVDSTDATLSTGLLNLRLSTELGEDSEIFGRIGAGIYTVEYDDYAFQGSLVGSTFVFTSQSSVEFTGTGFGLGLGVEFFFDQVGLEVGYTYHDVDFDEAECCGISEELPEDLSVPIQTVDLIVAYHF